MTFEFLNGRGVAPNPCIVLDGKEVRREITLRQHPVHVLRIILQNRRLPWVFSNDNIYRARPTKFRLLFPHPTCWVDPILQ